MSFGFVETSTPCLFRHPTRPITFCLVVDDFGVKYTNRHDFHYLVSCLSSIYHVKAHPLAARFLGFTIQHDRQARTLSLAYPGYIDALLARLRPDGIRPCSTPSVYVPPRYGLTTPQSATNDHEPPASAAQCKELQIAVVYLLYYGRCVDSRFLPATCALACEHATATLGTVARLNRLLGYASSHRDGCRIYRPSDMLLRFFSDASFLSRPKAGSVGGSFHYLSRYDTPTFVNAPISCSSYRIPVVCSSVQEAEYGGLFAAAKIAIEEPRILNDLGYPQPPTTILCDNEFAVGLAHRMLILS